MTAFAFTYPFGVWGVFTPLASWGLAGGGGVGAEGVGVGEGEGEGEGVSEEGGLDDDGAVAGEPVEGSEAIVAGIDVAEAGDDAEEPAEEPVEDPPPHDAQISAATMAMTVFIRASPMSPSSFYVLPGATRIPLPGAPHIACPKAGP